MRLVEGLLRVAGMPPSRRRQWLAFKRDQAITGALYSLRLKRCGKGSIVQKPLFWTPEFIELGDRILIWRDCRIEGLNEYGGITYTPVIRLEDGVSLQQACHIVVAGELFIGRDTTISSGVFISDADHDHEELTSNVLDSALVVRPTRIGPNCFIGSGARILAGTRLGAHCTVGANAVVRGVFPDYCVIAGLPARIIKRFDADSGVWRKTNSEGNFLG